MKYNWLKEESCLNQLAQGLKLQYTSKWRSVVKLHIGVIWFLSDNNLFCGTWLFSYKIVSNKNNKCLNVIYCI